MLFKVDFTVAEVRTFNRVSGSIGQEVRVFTPDKHVAKLSAPDTDIIDLSNIKYGDKIVFTCELVYQYVKSISSTGKEYSYRLPTFKIVSIPDLKESVDIEIN